MSVNSYFQDLFQISSLLSVITLQFLPELLEKKPLNIFLCHLVSLTIQQSEWSSKNEMSLLSCLKFSLPIRFLKIMAYKCIPFLPLSNLITLPTYLCVLQPHFLFLKHTKFILTFGGFVLTSVSTWNTFHFSLNVTSIDRPSWTIPFQSLITQFCFHHGVYHYLVFCVSPYQSRM